jgi:hypothetical protein
VPAKSPLVASLLRARVLSEVPPIPGGQSKPWRGNEFQRPGGCPKIQECARTAAMPEKAEARLPDPAMDLTFCPHPAGPAGVFGGALCPRRLIVFASRSKRLVWGDAGEVPPGGGGGTPLRLPAGQLLVPSPGRAWRPGIPPGNARESSRIAR